MKKLSLISLVRKKIYCKQQEIYLLQKEHQQFYVNVRELQMDVDRLEEEKAVLETSMNSFLASKLEAKTKEYNELHQKYQHKLSKFTSRHMDKSNEQPKLQYLNLRLG